MTRVLALVLLALALPPTTASAHVGDRDYSFGDKGIASTAAPGELFAADAAPDGTAIVGGVVQSSSGDYRMAVGRVTAVGAFDGGFGLGGLVTTAFPDTILSEAQRVASTPAGVLAVGGAQTTEGVYQIAMARYRANGSLDTTFGTSGRALRPLPGLTDSGSQRRGLAVLPDGRFLVVADAYRTADSEAVVAVARFTAAGALDTGFGSGGVATVVGREAHDIAVDDANRILVPGTFPTIDGDRVGVARFTPAGVLDSGFGDGGVGVLAAGVTEPYSVVAVPGGGVVAGGSAPLPSGDSGTALAALTPGGAVDTAFGGGDGMVAVPTTYAPRSDELLRRPDGRLLAIAMSQLGVLETRVAGFTAAGAPDLGWGVGGQSRALTTTGRTSGDLLADGRVLVGAPGQLGRLRGDVNGLPSVSIDAPAESPRRNAPVPLTAEPADPDGRIVSVVWDLDDDGAFDDASGRETTARFPSSGTVEVSVRVTDDDGARATASRSFTVAANAAPVAQLSASPAAPLRGELVTFDPAGSADPDGTIAEYAWDLDGDGVYEERLPTPETRTARFPEAGAVTVSLRVTSEDGAEAVATVDLDVRGQAPQVSLPSSGGVTGSPVRLTASAFDPDGDPITGWAWDLDDDGEFDDGAGPSAAPVFARPGDHRVSVRATDAGGDSGTASATVTVTGRPPIAAATVSPQPVAAGALVTLDASASQDPDGEIAEYVWEIDGAAPKTGKVVTHSFDTPGVVYVSLRVTDDDGAVDVLSVPVRVAAPAVVAAANDRPSRMLAAPPKGRPSRTAVAKRHARRAAKRRCRSARARKAAPRRCRRVTAVFIVR